MKAALFLFVLLVGTLCVQAELSADQLAQIRAQAEQEAFQAILSEGGRSAEEIDADTLEKAIAVLEQHLALSAARDAARAAGGAVTARRLLSVDPQPYESFYTSEDDVEFSIASTARHLLAYEPHSVRPSAKEAAPYCSAKPNTYTEIDPDKNIQNGFINTTDPGTCCAACLFRNDCLAWSIKTATQSDVPGCYLRGAGYKTVARAGYTSGVMTSSAAWSPPKTPKPVALQSGKTKYAEVLKLTYLFFAAQRSGEMPPNNPISWRKSAHVDDPVYAGWYDAGDTVKAALPISTSVSFIAWAMLSFPKSFDLSRSSYLNQLRVGNDYLLRSYDEKNKKFTAQVGNPATDHAFWGRPQENNYTRKAYVYDSTMKASDLLSSVAAGWAATSVVFKSSDSKYSATLLAKAKSIYAWAKSSEGRYSDYYPTVTKVLYPSTDYLDNQAWAAAWLYRATGDKRYLNDAASYWQRSYGQDPYIADVYPSWDSLWAPTAVLMRQFDRKSSGKIPGMKNYNNYYEKSFLPAWVKGAGIWDISTTPKGMSYPSWNIWGNLQFSTTAAMVMLQDMWANPSEKMKKDEFKFAKRQVDYALGSNGRSYVVGWGANPPKYIYHPGSSCPNVGYPCDWQNFYMRAANPQTVTGALVGGPAGKRRNPSSPDSYVDLRKDFATNEPTLDKNAGFAGALAGMYAYGN